MYLYHYFDKRSGPFRSVTQVPLEEGNSILDQMKNERPDSMCAKRDPDYIKKRSNCEAILRKEFASKGGMMDIASSHYMVVEHSPWLSTWYEQCGIVKIPIEEFDVRTLSFTYGDSMPEEILEVIAKYGLPQDWNDDGAKGPERYIEAHVWTDDPIRKYRDGTA